MGVFKNKENIIFMNADGPTKHFNRQHLFSQLLAATGSTSSDNVFFVLECVCSAFQQMYANYLNPF